MRLNSLQRERIYALTGIFLPLKALWCSSRLPWQGAARHDEFMLTDDNGEDVDQPQGFQRLRPTDRSRCKIFLLLLGLLLMFGIGMQHKSRQSDLFFIFTSLVPAYKTLVVSLSPGFLVGNANGVQRGPKKSNGRDAYQDNTEDGVPKFRPSPVTHLFWRNISQLLKQKLTTKAFDETLPYVRPHPLPHTEGVDSAETLNPI